MIKSNRREERIDLDFTSRSQSVTVGLWGRDSGEELAGRSYGEVVVSVVLCPLTGLLLSELPFTNRDHLCPGMVTPQ